MNARPRDRSDLVVDDADVVASLFGSGRGEADGGHLGICERHLRNGLVVGGRRMSAPDPVVDGVAVGTGGDHVSRGPSLILALMGEQRAMVDVADGVQPLEAPDEHRIVDIQPVTGRETHGVEAEVERVGRAAGRDDELVGNHIRSPLDGDRDLVANSGDGCRARARVDHRAHPAQRLRDELAGKWFLAREQLAARDDRD